MREIAEREKALNLHFREGLSYNRIAKEMNLPMQTVKSWIHRYRKEHGIPTNSDLQVPTADKAIVVKREYKPREKTPEKTAQERIEQLEMEVELLRTFLLERERRSIRG